jgi:hypothetical protein
MAKTLLIYIYRRFLFMEAIFFMSLGMILGSIITAIYYKFNEIDAENERKERQLSDIIYEQRTKIDALEMQLERVKTDIEAQK